MVKISAMKFLHIEIFYILPYRVSPMGMCHLLYWDVNNLREGTEFHSIVYSFQDQYSSLSMEITH